MSKTPKILIIGSGGREHALAWKIAGDSARPEVFIAPGNAGTAGLGANLPIRPRTSKDLLAWAQRTVPT
jgi:phosphoribosylamine--glycine ligase